MKRVVYTSLDNFSLKKWSVRSYKRLHPELVEWVEETTVKLLCRRNEAEVAAETDLTRLFPDIEKQVFFMIRHRCYFLDYFSPGKKTAIEIDGKYHRDRVEIDRRRDQDFSDIGIRTIRIKSSEVLKGNTLKALEIKRKKKRKKKVRKFRNS